MGWLRNAQVGLFAPGLLMSTADGGGGRAGSLTGDGLVAVTAPAAEVVHVTCGAGVTVDGSPPEWTSHSVTESSASVCEVISTSSSVLATTRIERAETYLTVTVSVANAGSHPVLLGGLQAVWLDLTGRPESLRGFASGWGREYEPVELDAVDEQLLCVSSGRSSQGHSPWLAVEFSDRAYVVAVHWSGNWQIRTEPAAGGLRVIAGLAPDYVSLEVAAGGSVTLPSVTVGFGPTTTAAAEGLVARVLAHAPDGPPLLTEWNHWWPYEDKGIDEEVFLANAAVAADVGLEVAVLDAGWFGGSAIDSDWEVERGDWHRVNAARFPRGLGWLADETRRLGIDFGIWVEPEAAGNQAEVRRRHPEFMATSTRAPSPEARSLGYVCLGSPAAARFVQEAVRELIRTTTARWVKWDFNLDPGLGCDRSDHGHLPDEGLVRHYAGLYRILDNLRAAFPQTVFEGCSSGGLRMDPGLAEHVDCMFLSDPDWTEHHLSCLWGACQTFPPRQILHWMESEWRGEHPFQKVDYSAHEITVADFDAKVQAAMLQRFGVSARLTQMRADLRDRLRQHLSIYQTTVRPVLERGLLLPLNAQPLRDGRGNRKPAFQLTSGDTHVVAAFRLPPVGGWEPVLPQGLDRDALYAVRVLDLGGGESPPPRRTGATLMSGGIPLPGAERSSTMVLLTPSEPGVDGA